MRRASSAIAAVEREAPDARLGQAECRVGRSDDDVAAEHHLQAAAQRVTVDARDHRHVERVAQRNAAEAAGTRAEPNIRARSTPEPPFMSAPVQNARSPDAGQHDDADIASLLDRLPDADQLRLGRLIDGVDAAPAGRSSPARHGLEPRTARSSDNSRSLQTRDALGRIAGLAKNRRAVDAQRRRRAAQLERALGHGRAACRPAAGSRPSPLSATTVPFALVCS